MALLGAIEFDRATPPYIQRELLIGGYIDWRDGGERTPQGLIAAVSRREKAFVHAAPVRYHLLTSLSVHYDDAFRRIKIDKCWLRFYRWCPPKYEIASYDDTAKQYGVFEEEATWGTSVVVEVEDQSLSAAAFQGLDAVGLLVGIWNLWAGFKRFRLHDMGPWEPIGSVNVGPLHTLYFPDGKQAAEFIVYEREHRRKAGAKGLPHADGVQAYTKKLLKRINQNRDPLRMREWLRRYGSALRLQSHESAFLRLWALLEQLTFTGATEGLTKAVSRASFLWPSPDVHREVLKALHKARNIHVHSESHDSWETTRLWQTKKYVDELLAFHLEWGRHFPDEELGRFMDAPCRAEDIERQIKVLRAAKRYRGTSS